MKEMILQKSNFRCRENIYICRPLLKAPGAPSGRICEKLFSIMFISDHRSVQSGGVHEKNDRNEINSVDDHHVWLCIRVTFS